MLRITIVAAGDDQRMPFDIRQLRYAIAAADHGSFYRAARALEVEQSTLSRTISKLERLIAVKLFERSRSGISITIAGARFIRSARFIVINAELMLASSRAAGQGRAGSLVLGLNSSVSAGNLRATMLAWAREHPDVDLDGVEGDRGALLAGLDTGEIDIAILLGEAGHDGFRREAFWSERILIALPTTHRLASQELVHWTDLRSECFALPTADPASDIRDMLLGRLPRTGSPPDIRMYRTSRETVLSLLGDAGYVSVVSEGSTGARYPDVVYRPILGEQGPALTIYSGYWRADNTNPPLRRFLAFIRHRYALSFDLSEKGNDQERGA
jgi:DNA-binding transcriptional LysR family regulator